MHQKNVTSVSAPADLGSCSWSRDGEVSLRGPRSWVGEGGGLVWVTVSLAVTCDWMGEEGALVCVAVTQVSLLVWVASSLKFISVI